MTNRGLIEAMIMLHIFASPFALIAIGQIHLNPRRLTSYIVLIPVILLLSCAYTDYLGELLRRRSKSEDVSRQVHTVRRT